MTSVEARHAALLDWWLKDLKAPARARVLKDGYALAGSVSEFYDPSTGQFYDRSVFYLAPERILPVRADQPGTVSEAARDVRAASAKHALEVRAQRVHYMHIPLMQTILVSSKPRQWRTRSCTERTHWPR